MHRLLPGILAAFLMVAASDPVLAQSTPSSSTSQDDGWRFAIYPVLAWLPYNANIDVNLPPGGGGGGGGGGGQEAATLNSHFDGAFLAGFSATNGVWRIDTDGLWASIGGDREPKLPNLSVDVDVIYGHASVGHRIAPDVFVTAGIRRIALKYDVTLGALAPFTRKPGVWDPLVGIAWHREGKHLEWHGVFEGGGFGAGSDVDLSGTFRLDWKPVTHFGLTGGYSLLYFKVSQDVANQTFIAKNTFSGPIVGIGFYF
jgi:hypothetical protein